MFVTKVAAGDGRLMVQGTTRMDWRMKLKKGLKRLSAV